MADITTAARPYARAVYQHASDSGSVDDWKQALELLAQVVADDAMRSLLEDPQTGALQKGELLLKVVGDRLTPQQQNLVRLMAENGRLGALPQVQAQYENFRTAAEGKIEAEVVSAYPLSSEQESMIVSTLKNKLGREVSITTSTDESLIGGVVIKAGDTIIDGSMKSQLESLALSLGR